MKWPWTWKSKDLGTLTCSMSISVSPVCVQALAGGQPVKGLNFDAVTFWWGALNFQFLQIWVLWTLLTCDLTLDPQLKPLLFQVAPSISNLQLLIQSFSNFSTRNLLINRRNYEDAGSWTKLQICRIKISWMGPRNLHSHQETPLPLLLLNPEP